MRFIDRCRPVQLIVSDVDGVMTAGGVTYSDKGAELKTFHIRDGLGIKLWQRAGFSFGIITGRKSPIVELRATELGVRHLYQGQEQKLPALQALLTKLQLAPHEACYLGDDLPDLPIIRYVGLGVAVADAAAETKASAHHITRCPGGTGAVREMVELILKAQGRWDEMLAPYLASQPA